VVAWGLNQNGQCKVPTDLAGVVAVAAGGYHSMALKVDGSLVAWGLNNCGQCYPIIHGMLMLLLLQ
jgi:alpha-tubulin suppressor-like RCC1 family protein